MGKKIEDKLTTIISQHHFVEPNRGGNQDGNQGG